MMISPAQCRAARALVGLSQDDLAAASKVAKATIGNFEAGKRSPYQRTLDDICAALEAAGVEFINGDRPGVRLNKPVGAVMVAPSVEPALVKARKPRTGKFGYRRADNGALVEDEAEQEHVREMVAMKAEGKSLRDIRDGMKEKGVDVSHETVAAILRRLKGDKGGEAMPAVDLNASNDE
jgi:transcriptional regulator with XRE-family HTH domain